MSIFGPSIPDHQRRYSPEHRVVLSDLALRDVIDRGLRALRSYGSAPVVRRDDVEQLLEDVFGHYVALREAYSDATDRETRLRQAIRQEIIDGYFPEDDEPIDSGTLARVPPYKALVATYGEAGEDLQEGWFMFGRPTDGVSGRRGRGGGRH
jgi:hypothetical protein